MENGKKLSIILHLIQKVNYVTYSKLIIRNYITDYYDARFHIIRMIPCNTELIIIATSNSNIHDPDANTADIFRYNEELQQIKLVYRNFEYHKGKMGYSKELDIVIKNALNLDGVNAPNKM